ncbi:MAG TPA: tyrosine-protein phosphatase [Solirubrobacteraceae bacterium]|nr:tyrosine-protein phosphatase [Solirubrobacteraceae bacterium]
MSVRDRTPQWLDLDGAVNARAVIPGVLLRADNLQSLSAQDVRRLVDDEALEVVLDLRTDTEVEREGPGPITAAPGVRVEHRSLYPDSGGNTDLDAAVKPWGREDQDGLPDETPIVRAYVSYLRRRPDSVVGSIRTIARADGAVLVHCAAGKDRTGVVVALALDACGVERDAIVSDYLATDDRIDAIFERLLSSPTYREELKDTYPTTHAPVAATMERFFALMDDAHGGSAQWLQANGLDTGDLELLRQRLTG